MIEINIELERISITHKYRGELEISDESIDKLTGLIGKVITVKGEKYFLYGIIPVLGTFHLEMEKIDV